MCMNDTPDFHGRLMCRRYDFWKLGQQYGFQESDREVALRYHASDTACYVSPMTWLTTPNSVK
jgi:hypothetical protein